MPSENLIYISLLTIIILSFFLIYTMLSKLINDINYLNEKVDVLTDAFNELRSNLIQRSFSDFLPIKPKKNKTTEELILDFIYKNNEHAFRLTTLEHLYNSKILNTNKEYDIVINKLLKSNKIIKFDNKYLINKTYMASTEELKNNKIYNHLSDIGNNMVDNGINKMINNMNKE